MNLEIKHLAAYLPYDLRVIPNGSKQPTRIQGIQLNPLNIIIVRYGEIRESKTGFEWVKPILRPLSDLVNKIEINGIRFIPIVELLKIQMTDAKWDLTSKYDVVKFWADENHGGYLTGKYYTIRYSYELSGGEVCVTDLMYDTAFNRFTLREKQPREKQLWLSYKPHEEKLLEWHFDVFGLIEKGLAIDKNTLVTTS